MLLSRYSIEDGVYFVVSATRVNADTKVFTFIVPVVIEEVSNGDAASFPGCCWLKYP